MNWLRHEFSHPKGTSSLRSGRTQRVLPRFAQGASLHELNCPYNAPQGAIHEPTAQFMKSLISIRAVRQFIEFALQTHYNIVLFILQTKHFSRKYKKIILHFFHKNVII